MRNVLAAIALVAMSSNVMAATLDGVWSNSPNGCAWRKNQDQYPKDFESITYMDASGVRGWEWGCDFLSANTNKYGHTVYVSACSAEGDSWPDLILVSKNPMGAGYTATTREGSNHPMEYAYKCE